MDLKSFEEKWGKSILEKIIMYRMEGKLDSFLEDIGNIPDFFNTSIKKTIITRDVKSAAKLALSIDFENVNIVPLNGYISEIENKTFDDLNHRFLEDYDGTVLLFFEDSVEADVTQTFLEERYKHIKFYRIPYGVSIKSPASTDKETINKIVKNFISDKL